MGESHGTPDKNKKKCLSTVILFLSEHSLRLYLPVIDRTYQPLTQSDDQKYQLLTLSDDWNCQPLTLSDDRNCQHFYILLDRISHSQPLTIQDQ